MPKDPTLIPRLRGISIVLAAQGDTMMAQAIDGAITELARLQAAVDHWAKAVQEGERLGLIRLHTDAIEFVPQIEFIPPGGDQ